jgi:hypothetical protein
LGVKVFDLGAVNLGIGQSVMMSWRMSFLGDDKLGLLGSLIV